MFIIRHICTYLLSMTAQNNFQARLDAIAQKCGIKPDQNDLQLLMYFDEAHCLQVHKTLHEEKPVTHQAECVHGVVLCCKRVPESRRDDSFCRRAFLWPNLPLSTVWSSHGRVKDADLQPPFVELPFESNVKFVEGGLETTLSLFCSLEKLANQSRPL